MNSINITITAGSGLGKTTLSRLLETFLSEQGFVVNNFDIDASEKKNTDYMEAAISRLKERVNIQINTIQPARTPQIVS